MELLNFSDLNPQDQELLRAAKAGMEHAYLVLGRFKVGAALLTRKGSSTRTITAGNVENFAITLAMCAERCAIYSANTQGQGDSCVALAIVAGRIDPVTKEVMSFAEVIPPCAECRGIIYEHAVRAKRSGVLRETGDFRICISTPKFDQDLILVTNIGELYPMPFDTR